MTTWLHGARKERMREDCSASKSDDDCNCKLMNSFISTTREVPDGPSVYSSCNKSSYCALYIEEKDEPVQRNKREMV
jgi:hypothetical protein